MLTQLSNCDREPIHTPGSIQPHGFLFVLDPATWIIRGLSTNARDFLWREASALIGSEIQSVLGDELTPALERASANPDFAARAVFVKDISLDHGGESSRFTLVAHNNGESVILEGEPASDEAPFLREQDLQHFLRVLSTTESLEDLQQLALAEVRRISGFDRCLLYQFDPDWNGVVIAEDRNNVLPKYLNQRFPAADIPRQARELYRRNLLRLIPSNSYRPVPIAMRGGGTPTQLDLSLSVLRSVSPIHLEYMRNMGTGSSMSVSLMRGTELWGLIACHSLQPRWVPFATRSACEMLGQFLSAQLASREKARELASRLELHGVLIRLISEMARNNHFAPDAIADDLLRLGNASGAAVITGTHTQLYGKTPSLSEVTSLVQWLSEKPKALRFSNHLSQDFLPAANFVQVASGLLAIELSVSPKTMILWFRPELIDVIEWSGEPRKAIEAAGEGRDLHPRKSFEIWRETVRHQSAPWEPSVISIVGEFREAASNVVLRQT